MKKKQTNYLEEATNRFIQELRSKGIKVQTLEPIDNGKSKILLFQELKLRRETMVKIIWKELKEDDPIFKTGFIISNPKLNFKKKRKGKKNEKIIFFLYS